MDLPKCPSHYTASIQNHRQKYTSSASLQVLHYRNSDIIAYALKKNSPPDQYYHDRSLSTTVVFTMALDYKNTEQKAERQHVHVYCFQVVVVTTPREDPEGDTHKTGMVLTLWFLNYRSVESITF